MGTPFLENAATTSVPAVIRRALVRLGQGTDTDAYKFLGTTDADRQANLADEINSMAREVEDHNLKVNLAAEATLTVTASTRYTDLPASLRRAEIFWMKWDDSAQTSHYGKPITLVSASEVFDLPLAWRQDDYELDFPEVAAIDYAASRLLWYPMSNANRTVRILARHVGVISDSADATNILVTTDDLTKTTAVFVGPDYMNELYVLGLAWRLSSIKNGPTAELTIGLKGEFYEALARIQKITTYTPQQLRTPVFGFSGHPQIDAHADPFEVFDPRSDYL